ncbi:hypothetical protein HYV86_04500 [Candidatus Woesearchaeota archaeon]|nr:hypothetical protein [Candidatus Woesearchaeota archaeon]
MVTLALPALASHEGQVRYVVSLLDDLVVKQGFHAGIQLLLFSNVIDDVAVARDVERISKNVVPSSFRKIFHAPISPHAYDSRLNLACEESVEVYVNLAHLVERCGGESMIIHTNCTYDATQWKSPLTDREYISKTVLPKVYAHIKAIIDQSPIPILLENLPNPLKGDATANPHQTVFDPFLATIGQIKEFYDSVDPRLDFCFDTSHYGILARQVNRLAAKYGVQITSHHIDQEGLKLYPQDVLPQPSLLELYPELKRYFKKKITCVQLADYRGEWRAAQGIDKGSVFDEGYVVGEGDLGQELLDMTVAYARDYPTGIISVDVGVADFLKRDEQIVSLNRVVAALKKAKVR